MARARHIAAGLAVALALGGSCRGPSVLSIGTTTPMPTSAIYLSPNGFDDNCCATQVAPWKTFARAVRYLKPGSTLFLEDGTYDGTTTGYLNIRCDGATADAGASVSTPQPAANGTTAAGMGITVQAEHKGLAFLSGDGKEPPLTIDACQNWSFSGLHVEALGAGAAIDVGVGNLGLEFTGLLVARAAPLLQIADGSNDITVADSEFYDFQDAAIRASRTDALKLLRNYINARATGNATDGGIGNDDGTAYGILLEETSNTLAANNVIEDVDNGIGVMGRDVCAPVISPPSAGIVNNRLYGNIVLHPMALGIRIDSRCYETCEPTTMAPTGALAPCPDARIVKDTDLEDDVVIGGDVAVSSAGAVDTVINELTAMDAANGVRIIREPQNNGVTSTSTTSTSNTLVTGFQAEAFEVMDAAQWSFDHCAVGGAGTFMPNVQSFVILAGSGPGNITNQVPFMPDPQGCRFYISAGSSLKGAGAGGRDVGANVIYQYQGDGSLSQTPLWSAAGFPCGAAIINVANACTDVAKRLDPMGTCPLPP